VAHDDFLAISFSPTPDLSPAQWVWLISKSFPAENNVTRVARVVAVREVTCLPIDLFALFSTSGREKTSAARPIERNILWVGDMGSGVSCVLNVVIFYSLDPVILTSYYLLFC